MPGLQKATPRGRHPEPQEAPWQLIPMTSSSSAAARRAARWPAGCPPTRATRVLVLEAGRPDYIWDPFIHMPAALTFPIGNRFYDWKYESEPEPYLNGRRIYHARGKVLGGSSSINGMIFQRGNPLDYERWAADPGMADWDYAHCLPYFKRMENCLAAAADDPFRGHDGPLVLERGPATSPLFRAFFAAVQQAGYPLTDDVNGYRQEGFAAFDRNIHRGRRLSRRAGLPAPGDEPAEPRPWPPAPSSRRSSSTGTRAVGRRVPAAQRAQAERRPRPRREVILCGGAINSPQLLQLSGVGNAAELRRARHRRGRRPARRGREPAGPPRGVRPVRVEAAGLGRARAQVAQPARGRRAVAASARRARAPPTTSRAAGSPAATTTWPTRT